MMYIDISDSTTLSYDLPASKIVKLLKLFSYFTVKIIHNYNGYSFKFQGDSILAIFLADEAFTSMSDNAIQSATMIRSFFIDILVPFFNKIEFPEVGFKIGIDIGKVNVKGLGNPNITEFIDLIGYRANLAKKIQQSAEKNQILIGSDFFYLIHTNWQKFCEKIEKKDGWDYRDNDSGEIYEVYRYNGKFTIKSEEKG